MAFKLSTGLRNSLMGAQDTTGAIATLAFTVTTNVITASAVNLLTLGFRPGDTIVITGSALNNITTTLVSVASDGGTMVTTEDLATEAEGATVTITSVAKTFKDIFRNGVIRVYSGAEPADADADEGSGSVLLEITKDSGALTPGTATNGLNFDAIAAGVLSKNADVWSDAGLVAGTAAWFRLYDNGRITGLSTSSKRCQGRVSTSGTAFILSSTSIKLGATTTLDTADFTMPAG
jgi:hypothetical protein